MVWVRPSESHGHVKVLGGGRSATYAGEMEVRGGRFKPGIEVDKLLWLSVGDAVKRLSYGRDKTLLLQQDL